MDLQITSTDSRSDVHRAVTSSLAEGYQNPTSMLL